MIGGMVNFSFGVPEHGWLEFKISDIKNEVVLDTSDVPNNHLQELTIALNRLREGSLQEEVEFSLEPDFALCRFKVNNEFIDIEIYPNGSRLNPIQFSGLRSKVMHSVYKSLRDLESLDIWKHPDCDEKYWSWNFPHSELNAFKNRNV